MASAALPTSILPPQSILFALDNKSRSGGVSLNGFEQVSVSAAARWRARYATRVQTIDQRLTMRALVAAADGRAGTWLVPTCSGFQIVGNPSTGISFSARVPFSDTSTFSDTSEFGGGISAIANASAAIRARQMSIAMNDSTPPAAGLYFSIGENLYVITTASHTSAGVYSIGFRPGLRAAVAVGDVLNFSRPICRMRLASDNSGDMNLDLLRFADVTLDFVEDFTPAS